MKITKRQLRRIIREEKANLVSEGRLDQRRKDRDAMVAQMTFKKLRNKAYDLAGYLRGGLSTGQYESDDYWDKEHGQIPMLADIVDAAKIKAAEEGTTFDDPPEIRYNGGIFDYSDDYSLGLPAGVMESKMKITKRQLRRIIRESLQIKEGKLWIERTPYGISVEDDAGEYVAMGAMVKALLDAGDDDIFQSAQGVDPKSLNKMMAQHEKGVQGGLEKWDPDVLRDYYNVDLDRVVRLYARRMNLSVQEVGDGDDGHEPGQGYAGIS